MNYREGIKTKRKKVQRSDTAKKRAGKHKAFCWRWAVSFSSNRIGGGRGRGTRRKNGAPKLTYSAKLTRR